MKKCCKCKQLKMLDCFSKNMSRKDGLQSSCKECQNIRKRQYYVDNKEKFFGYNLKKRLKNKDWYEKMKKGLECLDCAEPRWYVLDFHHRDMKDKRLEVSKMVHEGYSIDEVKKEIRKCDVLCANCHRERHYMDC